MISYKLSLVFALFSSANGGITIPSDVGPIGQCTWEYFDHGQQMECGRSDEIIVGRCGSGRNKGQPWKVERKRDENYNFTNLQPVLDLPRTGLCVASWSTSMEQ